MNHVLREALAAGISGLLLVAYLMFLQLQLRKNPGYTVHAENRRARADWVSFITGDPARGLLAVQTLRNSTMAATFFSSTAVLLMIGTLNMALQADKVVALLHGQDSIERAHTDVWLVKILLLVGLLFVSFFSFALSVRLFNHVGYLINVAAAGAENGIGLARVTAYMTRAGTYYTIGMRAYYWSVPVVFWLFGPSYLVVSTVLLLFALFQMDRAPRV